MKRLIASACIFLGGLGIFLSIWWIGFLALMQGWSRVSSPDDKWAYLVLAALAAASTLALRHGIRALRKI
jgi:hypothetical protein